MKAQSFNGATFTKLFFSIQKDNETHIGNERQVEGRSSQS